MESLRKTGITVSEMVCMRLMYISSVVLFGTVGVFLRLISIPSEIVALSRGVIGCLTIGAVILIRRKRFDKASLLRHWKPLVLSGIFLGLNWLFLFEAYRKTSVAVASLCNYTAPLMVILVSPWILHERLTLRKILLVVTAALGILLVTGVGREVRFETAGIPMGMLAAFTFAGVVICNRFLGAVPALDRVFFQLLGSACTMLPYVLIKNLGKPVPVDLPSAGIVLMLGVVHTGFAYYLYLIPMASLPVRSVALLGYLEPVVSVLCSALILGDPMDLLTVAGTVLVIGSAALGEMPEKHDEGNNCKHFRAGRTGPDTLQK